MRCVRGFPRKTPGKSRENCWIFSRIAKCCNFWDFGHRERQTCREPWVDTAWTLSTPSDSRRVFFEIDSSSPECTKIAHRRSLAIFAADSGIAGNSAVGIKFVPFNRRENRRSLAIFFAEEIAHLGALKNARFCGGAVKIAAATAENRAILVHSVPAFSSFSD